MSGRGFDSHSGLHRMIKLHHNRKRVKPKSTTETAKNRSNNSYLIKRIIITNMLSLLVVAGTYFWMIYFLSNVGSFWDIFRGKEIYVAQDIIPPTAPYLSTIPEATKETSIDISGRTSEPGIKVLLYVDDAKSAETISDSDGNFTFTSVPVGLLPERVYAKAEDDSGNASASSTVYTVVNDIEPPELEITTPKDGEIHKDTGHSYRVTGITEPNVTVTINDQFAIINPQGEFSASIRLNEGWNELKITAKDVAQNETEQTITIKFEKID